MGTCFCTGACLRGEGCAARPLHTGRWLEPRPLTTDQIRQIVREEIQSALARPVGGPEGFNPRPRDDDPYLKGEGGNCGHTRVPDNTMCPLCWRRDGEWHQPRCPHDSFEWHLAPKTADA